MRLRSLAIVACAALVMPAFAQAQQRQPSIEESMVEQTNTVLTVLRVWHNQISQDQQTIAKLTADLAAMTKERDELKAKAPQQPDK